VSPSHPDTAGSSGVTFIAIRFAGADSSKLLQVFQAASQASGQTVTSVNIGGKAALKATDSSGSNSYFYVKNDTILGVTAPDDATAAHGPPVLPERTCPGAGRVNGRRHRPRPLLEIARRSGPRGLPRSWTNADAR